MAVLLAVSIFVEFSLVYSYYISKKNVSSVFAHRLHRQAKVS